MKITIKLEKFKDYIEIEIDGSTIPSQLLALLNAKILDKKTTKLVETLYKSCTIPVTGILPEIKPRMRK